MQPSVRSARKIWSGLVLSGVGMAWVWIVPLLSQQVHAEPSLLPGQIVPMRQGTIPGPSVPDTPRAVPPSMEAPSIHEDASMASPVAINRRCGRVLDTIRRVAEIHLLPSSRSFSRERWISTLPPLQRVTLTELNLIAIVWGAYGYTAMVQTPEGHGYTVRRGTRVGQNNGVVSAITERGIIVQERFTDVYGKKQEREYVKLLHPKEGSE